MRVGILRVEFYIQAAHSLKMKRSPLKRLLERLHTRYHCDAAEVACQEMHQRAVIGVTLVAADGAHLRQRLATVKQFLSTQNEMQLLSVAQSEHAAPEESFNHLLETPPHADK